MRLRETKVEKKRWHELVPAGQAYHISAGLDHRRMPIPVHGHDFAEICWVEAGRGKHLINGQRQVLEAGDLVFIRPTDIHALEAAGGEAFFLQNVAFPLSLIRKFAQAYFSKTDRYFWRTGSHPDGVRLDIEQREQLHGELSLLVQARRDDTFAIDCFLMNVFRILGTNREPLGEHVPDWLVDAMRRFDNVAEIGGGLGRFFQLAGRCPEHVARSMRRHCRTSPSTWVNTIRVDHAARLLETKAWPVTDVAAACGFDNLSYFHRLFKSRHGVTPRRYRKQFQHVM